MRLRDYETNKMVNSESKNPFIRPWMYNNCAAAEGSKTGGPLRGIVAGAITGGTEVCISYPTEFVKTQLQLDEKTGKARQYTGFMDVVKQTVKNKGVLGLYRGLSVLITFSMPKTGIRFGTFETLKSYAIDEKGNLNAKNRVLCGLGAGISEAIFAVTPMETIKVKFIHDQRQPNPKYKGLINGISTILKEEGFKGVYQGVSATIIKQGSNQAIRFYVVETCKNAYRGGDPTVPIPKLFVGLFGFAAAIASVYGNNPVDVVKTRMQSLEAAQYTSTWDCFKKIFKNEGVTAFYKGCTARLARVGVDVAYTFMAYDTIMDIFKKAWP
ncbi:putative tricarboxylate transport protein, mitochondrial [Lycorma delicatula]|uniref:putative tricarboxylate transport protein, mitochondrial n=1 Tax=Lycorma delicatula TaxID=130591 RepID=UPI003F511DE8